MDHEGKKWTACMTGRDRGYKVEQLNSYGRAGRAERLIWEIEHRMGCDARG